MKQVNVLNPQLPLAAARLEDGMGGRGKKVSGRMRMGSKWLQACALVALGDMMSGEVGESRGVRERASLWGTACLLASLRMIPLQTHILPGHDQDHSRLYRLRTTRP